MSYLPDDIRHGLLKFTGNISGVQATGGGCINHGAKITSDQGHFFIKWNDAAKFPGMFEAEARGLQLLASVKCIRIPQVVGVITGKKNSGILLEFIESRRTTATAGVRLGRQLAEMHRVTSTEYGLSDDNYMGSLIQRNTREHDLIKFFIGSRLEPQVKLATDKGLLPVGFQKIMDSLYARLPELLETDRPALIHGDLWSGNYLVDMEEHPVLIDPAVSFGHREMDIAMTKLFGGFPDSFYASYQEAFPMMPGFHDRLEIYNLYPLLIHVNLFGGSYVSQVISSASRYS